MSNALLNLVWPLDLPGPEKMVLVALADAARDPDDAQHPRKAWPPLIGKPGEEHKGLVRRTGLCKRAIQLALRKLEAAGHLCREERPGKGVLYTIHPQGCICCTGAGAAPVHESAPTGASHAPNPLVTTKTPSKTSSSSEKRARKAPAFAPPDWIPIDPWNGWLEMRRANGKRPTVRALELAVADLKRLADDGYPPGEVLDQSTRRNWTGLFEIKDNRNDVRTRQQRVPALRGERPDPALDMWRQAVEDERAERGAEADRGTWPALPAE